jgi:peptidoglycan/LPS O-acetylase OafA/YrhL
MPASSRIHLPLVDTLKGVCCLLIVCHHLAFYGPMSDIAHPLAPALLDWMAHQARMAVQVFLVVGGFLAAGALAPAGRARFDRPGPLILRRYRRLAMPYLAALGLCMLASAAARPWMAVPELLPDPPQLPQLLAHTFFLQDLLGVDALSAGVWYVAIDFQLFAVAALLLAFAQRLGRLGAGGRPWLDRRLGHALIGGLAALSLLYFNRVAGFDDTAFYFFGAYGMGMLAYWAGGSSRPARWTGLIAAVGLLALALDWRGRIAVALAAALALAWMRRRQLARLGLAPRSQSSVAAPTRAGAPAAPSVMEGLGRISYSVFLVHYPVCILVSLAVGRWRPADPLANACGMVAALVLSVGAGLALHHAVERPADTWSRMGRLLAILLACGLLARWLAGIA